MKKNKATVVLATLTMICCFLSYFMHKDVMHLVFAFAWLCISIGLYVKFTRRHK